MGWMEWEEKGAYACYERSRKQTGRVTSTNEEEEEEEDVLDRG